MADVLLEFEHGSGRYDASAEIYRFSAYDAERHILCAISQEAFTTLSGITRLDPDTADVIFTEWEDDIFAIARAKYDANERQAGGAVIIRTNDIHTG